VPAVKGLDYKTAEAKLLRSDLKVEVLARRSDLDVPVDVVVEQNPEPGERVDINYTVALVISAKER